MLGVQPHTAGTSVKNGGQPLCARTETLYTAGIIKPIVGSGFPLRLDAELLSALEICIPYNVCLKNAAIDPKYEH